MHCACAIAFTAFWPWPAPSAIAEESGYRVTPLQRRTAYWGGEDAAVRFRVQGTAPVEGGLRWQLTAAHRVLQRGEMAVAIRPQKPATVTIRTRLPEVKQGVVYKVQLAVSLVSAQGAELSQFRTELHLFPPDPFADRRTWLKALGITLYDPEHTTRTTFDEAEIPYRLARSLDDLRSTDEGLVVIAEGVSFARLATLADAITERAAAGVPVLCLAPSAGCLTFPGADGDRPAPTRVALRRRDVVRELDERLDGHGWPPDGSAVATTLRVTSRRGRVCLEITDTADGWPWLEVEFRGNGRLLVWGFAVIEHWRESPTPRYLLASALQRLEAAGHDEDSTNPTE